MWYHLTDMIRDTVTGTGNTGGHGKIRDGTGKLPWNV